MLKKNSIYGCKIKNAYFGTSTIIQVIHETEKAVLVKLGHLQAQNNLLYNSEIWIPKSQVEIFEDQEFILCPECKTFKAKINMQESMNVFFQQEGFFASIKESFCLECNKKNALEMVARLPQLRFRK